MATTTITPNMGIVAPVPGQDPGPDWATNQYASCFIIDSHDHSPGKGVQVTPAGLNINSDLTFNSTNATNLKTVRFLNLTASLAGAAPNLGCVYEANNELYYNDGVGNVVQITNSGNVNAGAGSITGLPSGTASATYAAGTFTWQQATNTPATMDMGNIIVRNDTASAHGVTIAPVNALANNYSLTLPTLPATQSIMTLDNSGIMSAPYTVDGSTIVINANVIQTGLPVVQANTPTSSPMTIIRIGVGSGGGLFAGEGATAILGSPGVYTITWDTPFSDVPVITTTIAGGVPFTAGVVSQSSSGCVVGVLTPGSVLTNANFNLIAIGHL